MNPAPATRFSHWTAAEKATLARIWATTTPAQRVAALPGRTASSIEHQGHRLGLRNAPTPWREEETAALLAHYEQRGPCHLGRLLGRTPRGVSRKARRLGLRFQPPPQPARVTAPYGRWTPAQEAALREHYPAKGGAYVAELLDLPVIAVLRKAQRAGVHRLPAVKAPKPVAKSAKPAKKDTKPQHRPVSYKLPPVPKAAPKAAAPKPTKAPALATPVLNAQKALRGRSEEARKYNVAVTANEVRKLPYNDPLRIAYTREGDRGVRAYLAQQGA